MAEEAAQAGVSPFTESVLNISSEDDKHTSDTEAVSPHRIPNSLLVKSQGRLQDRAGNDSSADEQDSFRSEAAALQTRGVPMFVPLGLPTQFGAYDQLSGTLSHASKLRRAIVFSMQDFQTTESSGGAIHITNPSPSVFASQLGLNKDLVFEASVKSKSTTVFILAAKRTDKYLLVQGEVTTKCLRLLADTTQQDVVQTAFPENHGMMCDDMFCFFVKEHRLERLGLPSLTESESVLQIKVVKIRMVRLAFVYRVDVFYEKHFIIKGKNTDCLHELKLKFLKRLCEKEHQYKGIDPSSVWFVLDNKLVSEQVLQSALCTSFSTRLLYANQSWGAYGSGVKNNLMLYVHFQPPDAIPVSVIFKPDPGKANKVEKLSVISPLISEQSLRQEVARVVEVEPEALKIYVGKKKLDTKLDIPQSLLGEPNVFVEVKPDIGIEIEIVPVPEFSGFGGTTSVRMYPYDVISKLKSEVCNSSRVAKESVDIWFGEKFLDDKMTANQCRLRDADFVKAYVFLKRVCIRVRSTNRRLYDVIVDDAGKTTVGDVKTFMESTDRSDSAQHQFSVLAIFNGCVLDDNEILINTGLCSKQKTEILVLFETNSICFTASSSLNGKFAVFRDTGEDWFQLTLAMSDGKDLFYAPEVSQTKEKIVSLVKERRLTRLTWTGCVLGIRVRPPSQMPQASQPTAAGLPTNCRSPSIQLPQSFHSTAAVLPFNCRSPSIQLPQSFHSTAAVLPFNCRSPPNQMPQHSEGQRRPVPSSDLTDPSPSKRVDWRWDQTTPSAPHVTSLRHSVSDTQGEHEVIATDSPPLQTDFITAAGATFRTSTPEPQKKQNTRRSESVPINVPQDRRVSRGKTLNPSFSLPERTEDLLRRFEDRPFISDEECGRTADKNIIHKSATFQCLEEKTDGKYVLRKYSESETLLLADAARKQLASGDTWTAMQNCNEGAKKFCSSALELVPDAELIIGDFTFRYIKRTTITEVSRKLGRDGLRLVRQLGVLDETIDQAQEQHPKNLAEQNYSMLTFWCRSAGAEAKPEILKLALRQCNRNDLVAVVDNLEATPETC